MTYRTDTSYDVGGSCDAGDEEPRRRLPSWILIVVMLIGAGCASALIWRTFGGGPILPSQFLTSMTSSTSAPVAVTAAVKPSGQGDATALRQEVTGSIQSTQALLAAQQAEIKRLSDQVSALSGKLELMQRPVTSAQAALPVPARKAVAPAASTPKTEAAQAVGYICESSRETRAAGAWKKLAAMG